MSGFDSGEMAHEHLDACDFVTGNRQLATDNSYLILYTTNDSFLYTTGSGNIGTLTCVTR